MNALRQIFNGRMDSTFFSATGSCTCDFPGKWILLWQMVLSLCAFALAITVQASPDGGSIVGGAGSIDKAGNKTTITQDSSHLVVDWESFNVGQKEHVHFEQGSASDSALNRIYDSRPSEIWGQITGRGRVWLLNPNGVIFSKTARVSTGGLVAAGLWMDKQDFMAGRYVLNASRGVGDVENAGTLESGNVGLIGQNVNNSGTIRASTGSVTLAARPPRWTLPAMA
ncbi:MAG: filamentous hemagglutinin N-terminal domain-containing protein [Candidatus Porifericomitaceae bacterium WSBS_2022_MAG_OTU9]